MTATTAAEWAALRGPILSELPLHERTDVRVTRLQWADGRRALRKAFLGDDAQSRLRNEARVLERLVGVEGVPVLLGVDPDHPAALLLAEDGSRPLGPEDREALREPAAWLDLAEHLTRLLVELHRRGVQHRHLHPAVLRLHGEQRQPLLAGFEYASTSAEEVPGFIHHSLIAGTLAYGSPEQTGRAGLGVDQRADLYALGVTLYELATGAPPFQDADPLRLIHHHLASRPVPPIEHAPELGQAASDLVLHLLEKSPDQRYQSAQGLLLDLLALRARWQRGDTTPFTPGLRDFPDWLAPPSRLVGRERETEVLAQALDSAVAGGRHAVLVAGSPGVGKTALINTLRPLVTARRGWYVAGKFDQLRQDQDTDAMRQAFRALGRLLLAEPEQALAPQRERLRRALGPNIAAIARLLPEFALLLGVTPDAPATGDVIHAETQLLQAALSLLRCLVSPERPLVMVIDDLQWAAATPLRLFELLLQDEQLPGLMLVGAYRANEVGATHPLQARLQRWEQLPRAPWGLVLHNLPAGDLASLLGSMLRLQATQADELAQAIAARTGGNPFDTVELVNALRREGALSTGEQGWHWDLAAIRRHVGQGDVVGLLQARIAALPSETQALLDSMACLGGEIELSMLAGATGLPDVEVERRALPALDDGLLLRVDGSQPALRFRHDRVQQAAHARLVDGADATLHLHMARRLAFLPAFWAVAAEQYLPAQALLDDPAECAEVARLFHEAALSLRLVNHAHAERLSRAGMALLQRLDDLAEQPLLMAMAAEHHLALYNLGRLDEADQAYAFLGARRRGSLDGLDSAGLQITSLAQRGRGREAVDLGLALLAALGTRLPEALPDAVQQGLQALQDDVAQGAARPESMRERPEVSDPQVVAVARLIDRLVIPTLQVDPQVNAWLAVESWRLWTTHGPCAALVRAVSLSVPLVLLARRQAHAAAHAVAVQALRVGEARGFDVATATARHVYAIASQHWFGPLSHSLSEAREAHEHLLRGGDLQFACLTFHATAPAAFDTAPTLAACAEDVNAGLAFARRTGNEFALALYASYRQLLRALQRETPLPEQPAGSFQDSDYDEAARESGRLAMGTMGAVYRVLRALSAALFGDLPRLQQHIDAAWPLLGAMPGFHPTAWAHALRALSLAERLRHGGLADEALTETADTLGASLDWLAARAADQPANYEGLHRWIEAEQAWALGDEAGAARAFDVALQAAGAHHHAWQQALITERAARCHQAQGLQVSGRQLMQQAHRLYAAWGAVAKLRQLETEHPALRNAATVPAAATGPGHAPSGSASLDLMGVLQATRLLSSETHLPRLIARVVEVLGAMTGATDVLLLTRREQPPGWHLHLRERSDGQTLPLDEAAVRALLPMAAFRYVERTGEPLVVHDAVRDDRFAADPHFAGVPQCALLVMPVMSHGQAKAMLVLENRLSAGCCTSDRLDAVTLVAGQLAVSLENAQLYAELEQRVEQRTEELRVAQSQLLDTARRAGMAEIATNVLHNVGNVLNSVNVSADLIGSRLRASKAQGFGRAVALLDEHQADLAHFLSQDEKGRRLPAYLGKLVQAVELEQAELLNEVGELSQRIGHIKEIVSTQQSYAGRSSVRQGVRMGQLVRDALQMTEASMARHQVNVTAEVPELPELQLDRPRILQILVNLLANAKQACSESEQEDAQVQLSVTLADGRLQVTVADNGMGIAAENLTRVFAHGFTTRRNGHGFGLHSCVLAAQDMGGSLQAFSEGVGRGARFVLSLPVDAASGA